MVYWNNLSWLLRLRKDALNGNWNRTKQRQFNLLYGVPGVKQLIDYDLDTRNNEYYLRTHDMDYSDVYDPRNLSQARSGSALSSFALNFVSSNVTRLYADSVKKKASDAYDRGFRNANNYWSNHR